MNRPRVWGDGAAERVRQRAAEELKLTAKVARKLGVDTVVGFVRSLLWPLPAPRFDAGFSRNARD